MFKRIGWMALLGAVAATTPNLQASQPTDQERKIQELEQRIAELETRQLANSAEFTRTVDAMLRDAESRSQLLAAGGDMSAGYDNGFFIRGGDDFLLRFGSQFQFRYAANLRDGVGADDDEETDDGFEVRRLRFDLAGYVLTPRLTYFVQWESVREGGDMVLLEAWARYMFSEDWGMRVGQFKDPVIHEFLLSTKRGLAADTSLMDSLVGGGVTSYTQGVTLIYGGYNADNPLNIEAGFTDGANQVNTDFTDRPDQPLVGITSAVPKHAFDYGLAGRAEYKFFGNWKSYSDFTAIGTTEDLLVAGAGVDFSQGGDGDLVVATADLQYENSTGLGLYGAAVMRHLNGAITGLDDSRTDWGYILQAAYAFNPKWEVYARYDQTFYDEQIVFADGASEDTFPEITVGVNRYLGPNGVWGQRAKITVDLTYLPNSAPIPVTGLGILDANSGDAEWVLRAQFQLLL